MAKIIKTAEQRKQAFIDDFRALLRKHGASAMIVPNARDPFTGPSLNIFMDEQYGKGFKQIGEMVMFDIYNRDLSLWRFEE